MDSEPLSRRDFLRWNAVTLGALAVGIDAAGAPAASSRKAVGQAGDRLVDVDFAALVSRSDLQSRRPAPSSAEGHPIGNGRMGTMVWTTPGALHVQVNRVDVFAVNSAHRGTFLGPLDICGACAAIAVDVGGEPLAASDQFRQHLSLYGAEASI